MTWRAAGARWDLLAEDHPIDDYERAPIGEVGCVDGAWYGAPTGVLVYDQDGWHVPTADGPVGAAAQLAAALGLELPDFPEESDATPS